MNKLISQTKNEEPWIHRNVLNFAHKKFCQKMETLVFQRCLTTSEAVALANDLICGTKTKKNTSMEKDTE